MFLQHEIDEAIRQKIVHAVRSGTPTPEAKAFAWIVPHCVWEGEAHDLAMILDLYHAERVRIESAK